MLKEIMGTLCVAFLAIAVLTPGNSTLAGEAVAKTVAKRIVLHVDENDKAKMNLALNNAANVYKYYKDKGEKTEIRIIAYGPGLNMLRADKSPVKDRIEHMALAQEGLTFAACGNTLKKMTKAEGKKPPIVAEATMVPSGVVELVELQAKGWTYIKP